MMVITGLSATVASCGPSNHGPTEPGPPTYTISGVITADRGGPLSGVTVAAFPNLPNLARFGTSNVRTDEQGRYSLSTPGTVGLYFWKEGFTEAHKNNVSPQESTVNLVLYPNIVVGPNGATVARTVRGDERMAGDDVLFGGLCAQTACKVIDFDQHARNTFEVRLRWADPTRQLALYVSRDVNLESVPFQSSAPDRYCCASELVAAVDTRAAYLGPYLAVAFEQAGGRPPGPTDSQAFELTVQIR